MNQNNNWSLLKGGNKNRTTSSSSQHQHHKKTKEVVGGSVATMEKCQSILVSKLNSLSIEERDNGLHDIHGVSEKLDEETDELLQSKIKEMNDILDGDETTTNEEENDDVDSTSSPSSSFKEEEGYYEKKKKNDYYAYKKAKRIDPKYVNRMKITCLRAKSYDSKRAAQLLIRFFHRKLQLFGMNCLTREITQQDLIDYNPEAEALLQKGIMRLLPYRDRAGRAIIFFDGKIQAECMSTDLVLRAIFYMCMVAIRDLQTQKEGVVLIYYGVDQKHKHEGRCLEMWYNWNSYPWRNVAFHMCMEGEKSNNIHTGLTVIFNRFQTHNVCRARVHHGSHMECIYNLLTFGIPKDAIPVSTDGSRDLTSQHSMLEMLKRREDYLYHPNNDNNNNRSIVQKNERSVKSSPKQQQQQQQQQRQKYPCDTIGTVSDTEETVESSTSSSHQEDHHAIIEDASSLMMMPLPTEPVEEKEEEEEEEELVLVPNPRDILLGKGRLPKSHQGNLRFHCLLQEYRGLYDSSMKREKTAVSQRLLQQLKSTGCRFLLPDKIRGGYTVVNDQVAREKISHGFRNLRILEERNKTLAAATAAKSSSSTTTTKKKSSKKTKSPTDDGDTTTKMYDEDSGVSDGSERSQFGQNKKQKNIDQ